MSYYAQFLEGIQRRVLIIAYIFDNLVLALITFGNCKVGETISSVSYVMEQEGKLIGRYARPFIDWLLSPFESDHCHKAQMTFLLITGGKPDE